MTDQQALSDKIIPDPFVWSNFKTVFDQVDLARYTWNTFLYAALSTVGVIVVVRPGRLRVCAHHSGAAATSCSSACWPR